MKYKLNPLHADAEEDDTKKIESETIASQAMESHGHQVKANNLGVAYRRYVGMHVSYFGAAAILSQFSKYLATQALGRAPFTVRIINTKQKLLQVSLQGITNLLKHLADEQNPFSQDEDNKLEVIEAQMKDTKEYEEIIWAMVKMTSGIPSAYMQFQKLFDGSGGSPTTLHNIMAVVHCKTELATLLKFGMALPASVLTGCLRELLLVRS
jgi:hypothetical protein